VTRLTRFSDNGLRIPTFSHLTAFSALGVTRSYTFDNFYRNSPKPLLAWFFFPIMRQSSSGSYETGYSGCAFSRPRTRESVRKITPRRAFTLKPGYISL
jgi:hypothetical protein